MFCLQLDPADWGPEAILTHVEPDDIIHNPDPKRRDEDYETVMFTPRGFANVGCLLILAVGLLALLLVHASVHANYSTSHNLLQCGISPDKLLHPPRGEDAWWI